MSEENITKPNTNFAQTLVDHLFLPNINFNGDCLIKQRIFISKEVINLYISYTLNPHLRHLKIDFMLCTCLFVSVKLVKNADLDNTSVAATV